MCRNYQILKPLLLSMRIEVAFLLWGLDGACANLSLGYVPRCSCAKPPHFCVGELSLLWCKVNEEYHSGELISLLERGSIRGVRASFPVLIEIILGLFEAIYGKFQLPSKNVLTRPNNSVIIMPSITVESTLLSNVGIAISNRMYS